MKALLWPVINWFASQTRGGWRMTLRGHEGDEEVTNTVQERREFADKNILRYRRDESGAVWPLF